MKFFNDSLWSILKYSTGILSQEWYVSSWNSSQASDRHILLLNCFILHGKFKFRVLAPLYGVNFLIIGCRFTRVVLALISNAFTFIVQVLLKSVDSTFFLCSKEVFDEVLVVFFIQFTIFLRTDGLSIPCLYNQQNELLSYLCCSQDWSSIQLLNTLQSDSQYYLFQFSVD